MKKKNIKSNQRKRKYIILKGIKRKHNSWIFIIDNQRQKIRAVLIENNYEYRSVYIKSPSEGKIKILSYKLI